MSRIVEEDNRGEFPFPRMDSYRSASPSSGSLPSRSDSSHSHSKSLRSSVSSGSPLPRVRGVDRGEHDSLHSGAPSKLLSRLMSREYQDTRSLRTIIAVTTERLESETRRADDAERRLLEVLRKLRAAHEATMLAQADAARAKEELTLYKYRLDDATREISRAQEIINELEQEKLEAEAEAARARSTARRYREQQLMTRAREEGRQAGFQEGFSQGKDMGYQEAMEDEGVGVVEERRFQKRPVLVEEVEDEGGEVAPSRYRAGTPAPDLRSRTPAPVIRVQTPGPEPRMRTPGPLGRPPSRMTVSRAGQRVSDAAHIADTLPVPTMTTPLNMPSPSHSRSGTPVVMPYPSSRPVGAGDVPTPIPIHNPVPSPMHPPLDIPPDTWIPYENAEGGISLPPPHELSRPVTPRSVSPAPPPEAPAPQPPAPPPQDYLYTNSNASQSGPLGGAGRPTPNIYRPFSPQSKASTSISQFDLVAPRVKSRGAKAREDRERVPTSPRGPRPREDLPPLRPVMEERQDTAGTSGSTEPAKSPTTPLDAEFKKRYRRRPTRGPSHESVIPDIRVEAPSTPSTSRSSTKTTITHPHLLSPETNPRPLTPSQDADVIVMRTEIPGYYPMVPPVPYQPPYHPPYPEDDDESPVIPPRPVPEGSFPPGFVPITPPIPADRALPIPSNNPLPIPSNNPLPIPQRSPHPVSQRNPLPTPQSNPLPIRPPSAGPLPVPQRNPLPVPDKGPVPIPHRGPVPIPTRDEPLPVPHRSGTPSRRYVEADMPPGVVYPSPPSRRSRTPSSSVTSPPGSRRTLRDMRSPTERLSPLPLQFFATMRSDTNTE